MTALDQTEPGRRSRADWIEVLCTGGGRRLLRRLFAQTNVLGASYRGGDALQTAYNEGVRAVARQIICEMETAAPGEFARLLLEKGEDDD